MPRSKTILARELRTIRSSFSRLARSFERIAPLVLSPPQDLLPTSPEQKTRRRPRLSAQRRQALKLQGKYMGMMRGMRPASRAKLKKIRTEKGIEAAIAAAEKIEE
ncbi:MAG TPA: hypothetical protein VJV23_07995 [Candidatus Polarisedimenticolia bacterium]|nr:hypothetical protein [Candidatus Polarisedimenticolia bacterium]